MIKEMNLAGKGKTNLDSKQGKRKVSYNMDDIDRDEEAEVNTGALEGHKDIEEYNPDQEGYEQYDDADAETQAQTQHQKSQAITQPADLEFDPLPQLVMRELLDMVTDRKLEEIEDFLKQNITSPAELRGKLDKGRTLLHYAVYRGKKDIVELLINKGCIVDARDKNERTPLHYAVANNKIQVIQILKEEGADVNAVDKEGRTPLHYCAMCNYAEIAFKLLCMGADPNICDNYEMNALDYCTKQLMKETLEQNGAEHSLEGRIEYEGRIISNSLYDKRRELLYRGEKLKKTKNIFQNVGLDNNTEGGEGDITHNDFIIHDILGKGSFGEVYLVEKIDNHNMYAMKVFSKRTIQAQNLMRFIYIEKRIMHELNHPFMVRLHYAFQTDRKLYLLMDYCKNRDLGYMLKKKKVLTEQVARIVIAELVLAVEALHSKDIVHRDLKPDNILLDDDGHIKVTDFGLAKEGMRKGVTTKTFCGSIAYLPPEIISKTPHSKMVDWYLVGVILYEMVVGKPPYFSRTYAQLSWNILNARLAFPQGLSLNTKKFIKQLLHRDPGQRLGAKKGGEEIKKHDFFIGIDWDQIYNRETPPFNPRDISSYQTNNYRQNIIDEAPRGVEIIDVPNWNFVAGEN